MAEASQVLIQKGLKIVHANVRSLLPKLPEIEKQFRGFDVIILTETWLSESVPSGAVVIDGYNLIRQDRWKYIKEKGGGLCCYIKTDVAYRNMLDLTEPVTSDYEIMGLVICPPNSKKVNVLAVYRPPDGKAQVFMDKLVGVVGNLDREHKETTIIGDFNMEFINQGPTRNKLVTLQNTLNLKQLINERTRLTSVSQSTIDLIFTDCMYVSGQGTINTNFSDHLPVYYIKKKARNNNKKTEVFGRSYANYDPSYFKQLLQEMNWEDYTTIQDPEELWKIMNRNIELVLDRLCPVQKLVIPESKPKWLTRDIILLMRDRDYFFARARRNNRADDWNISRFLRNRVNQAIKNHKATKIKKNLERHKSNPKKFWDSIRDILPRVKDNTLMN